MNKLYVTIFLSVFLFLSCNTKPAASQCDSYLLVGTGTSGESEGVNIYRFDTQTGASEHVSETRVDNPSYLAVSNNEKYVYTVSEGGEDSQIVAFGFDKKGGVLEKINAAPSGGGPCFISIDESGKYIVTANYGGGSISTFAADEKGAVKYISELVFEGESIHPERQTKPYLHNIIFSPDGRFLFANDLGTDKTYRLVLDKTADKDFLIQTTPTDFLLKAGSGPRHTEFHPNGKFVYTITELSGEVIAFGYDKEKEVFDELQTIVADTLNAGGSADIHITPNGKYLYASNRLKGDGLAIFSVDEATGLLTKIGYQETGIHPRNFVIAPNGKLLLVANRDSNTIQVWGIGEDGLLTNLNRDIELSIPVCLKFASLK